MTESKKQCGKTKYGCTEKYRPPKHYEKEDYDGCWDGAEDED